MANEQDVLTDDAVEFLTELEREFGPRRRELLAARQARAERLRDGELPDFLAETKSVREGDWRVEPVPAEIQDRRVEITGPVDRKMVINALNSGAKMFMADFEDSNSPTWQNCIEGQVNLTDALERTISLDTGEKQYSLNDEIATLLVRPRGWHLDERHFEVDGAPISASLFDFGLYFLRNHDRGGRFFYLPKLESHLEARLWNDVFVWAQDRARRAARNDQGDRLDRDDPRRLRDGGDPVRAARALVRPERGPLGLHLQRDQEARPPARVRAPRPLRGDHGCAVHVRVHRAAREDVPRARRACHGRHGGVHSVAARSRGERGRAREGARGQGARGRPGLRRHVGRAPRPRAGRDGDLRPRPGRPPESARAAAPRRHLDGRRPTGGQRDPGRDHDGGPAQQRLGGDPVPRGVAARVGCGRDLQPDGGRRDVGDLALAGLAVAPPRQDRAHGRRGCDRGGGRRSSATATTRRVGSSSRWRSATSSSSSSRCRPTSTWTKRV